MKQNPYSFLQYNKKQDIEFHSKKLKEIIKKFPTPFYLYSENEFINSYQNYFSSAVKYNIPHPLIAFAFKANNNPSILSTLKKLGCGADVVSGGELQLALKLKFNPQKIVFSGVGKTPAEITLGLESNIHSFNVESLAELEIIIEISKKLKVKAPVCFRYNPQVKTKTHKYISTGEGEHKFGMSDVDIDLALKKYENKFNFLGLSTHIGSQILNLKELKKGITKLCELANSLNRPMQFIDVGGGLGIDYEDHQDNPHIDDYMKMVSDTLSSQLHKIPPSVVFEPGRKLIARSGCFVTSVIYHKQTSNNIFCIVDGAMNDLIRPSLYQAYHRILPSTLKTNSKNLGLINVVGPVCETGDFFALKRKLPLLKSNEFYLIMDSGAYGYSMSSNYNLRPKPAEILLNKNGEVKLIRKAQTISDLLKN